MTRATPVDIDIDDLSNMIGQGICDDEKGDSVVEGTETTNDDEEGPVTLIDVSAVEITGAAEDIEEETERVNTSRYDKTDSMKIHHKSLKVAGHNSDNNTVPYMKMMNQLRTCERNSWTTTSIVLEN